MDIDVNMQQTTNSGALNISELSNMIMSRIKRDVNSTESIRIIAFCMIER
jgi:hypothetical protein